MKLVSHGKIVLVAALLGLTLAGGTVRAERGLPVLQATPAGSSTAPAPPIVTLKLLVTISTYDGEKKTSSQPFTLWVATGTNAKLSNARELPILTLTGPQQYTYRSVGTTISAQAAKADDGPFTIELTVSDSSVAPGKTPNDPVTLISTNAYNKLYLRDGQKADFFSSTDKVTGETTKIEITLTLLK